MKDISQRGQGFTTLQIQNAPENSLFIVHRMSSEPKAAEGKNIKFIPRSHIRGIRDLGRYYGHRYASVIVDHGIDLNYDEYDAVQHLRRMVLR